jgi:hypothetical protein
MSEVKIVDVAEVELGMGATRIGYTDCNPYEVVGFKGKKTVILRALDAELDPDWKPEMHPGGFSAHCSNQHSQKWTLTSNEENGTVNVRYSNSKSRARGWYDKYGQRYSIGKAVKFYDYNF